MKTESKVRRWAEHNNKIQWKQSLKSEDEQNTITKYNENRVWRWAEHNNKIQWKSNRFSMWHSCTIEHMVLNNNLQNTNFCFDMIKYTNSTNNKFTILVHCRCMRLRNGGGKRRGLAEPFPASNTHIYLYASTAHMYCIYPAILNRK